MQRLRRLLAVRFFACKELRRHASMGNAASFELVPKSSYHTYQELLCAVASGDLARVQSFVSSKRFLGSAIADIERRTSAGRTALMQATIAGHEEMVKLLLDAKGYADVHAIDGSNGRNACHYALAGGHLRIAQLLVDRGGDLALADHDGMTALGIAREHNNADAVALLEAAAQKAQAAARAAQAEESARFLSAAKRGDVLVALSLLSSSHTRRPEGSSALVNVRDPDGGETALIWACSLPYGHAHAKSLVKALINAGANVHLKDSAGWTALHWASDCGNAPIVKLLLGAGAYAAVEDHDGNTPLVLARVEQRNKKQMARSAASTDKKTANEARKQEDAALTAADGVVTLLEAALARIARAAHLRAVYIRAQEAKSTPASSPESSVPIRSRSSVSLALRREVSSQKDSSRKSVKWAG